MPTGTFFSCFFSSYILYILVIRKMKAENSRPSDWLFPKGHPADRKLFFKGGLKPLAITTQPIMFDINTVIASFKIESSHLIKDMRILFFTTCPYLVRRPAAVRCSPDETRWESCSQSNARVPRSS